jgi:hypothetical protein
MATAVAGYRLGINPFDQPNVEAAKVLARETVAEYTAKGTLPSEAPALTGAGIAVYGDVEARNPGEALSAFLGQAQPGAYVALQAYVKPTPEADKALAALRLRLRDMLKLATPVAVSLSSSPPTIRRTRPSPTRQARRILRSHSACLRQPRRWATARH